MKVEEFLFCLEIIKSKGHCWRFDVCLYECIYRDNAYKDKTCSPSKVLAFMRKEVGKFFTDEV